MLIIYETKSTRLFGFGVDNSMNFLNISIMLEYFTDFILAGEYTQPKNANCSIFSNFILWNLWMENNGQWICEFWKLVV